MSTANRTPLSRLLAIAGLTVMLPLANHASAADDNQQQCRQTHGERGGHPFGGPEKHGEDFGFGRLPHHLHGLGLSESQRDAVFTLVHSQAPAIRTQVKALFKARAELRGLAKAGQYDEARARALAGQVADHTGALALLRARLDYDIHALLTPEQRKQLTERDRDEAYQPVRAGARHRELRHRAM